MSKQAEKTSVDRIGQRQQWMKMSSTGAVYRNSTGSHDSIERERSANLPSPQRTCQMMEPSEFRRVLGHFPTGVAIVTGRRADGTPCGLTLNAFCSVSLDPALVLVCIEHTSVSHGCILDTGIFAVNVLEQTSGEGLARRFANWGTGDKFRGVAYRREASGAPVLEDALAWIDCRVWNSYPGGDHTIFVGEVIAADAREGAPLVYYRGGYGRFLP